MALWVRQTENSTKFLKERAKERKKGRKAKSNE